MAMQLVGFTEAQSAAGKDYMRITRERKQILAIKEQALHSNGNSAAAQPAQRPSPINTVVQIVDTEMTEVSPPGGAASTASSWRWVMQESAELSGSLSGRTTTPAYSKYCQHK